MKRIAFLFAGQGAQAPGMGVSLYENSQAARDVFEAAKDALSRDIYSLCKVGPAFVLKSTQNTQPCVLAVDLAAHAAALEAGLAPFACAGFSLGEIAALYAVGVTTLADTYKIVEKRAEFMAAVDGAMAALLCDDMQTLGQHIAKTQGTIELVNFNCPGQVVAAGEASAISELVARLRAEGMRAVPLKVSGPFHSSLMRGAAEKLYDAARGMTFHEPSMPLVMNTTGEEAPPLCDFARAMSEQCASPVLFEKSIRRLHELGAEAFIELGPGATLKGFVERTLPGVPCYSASDYPGIQAAAAALL